MTLSKFRHWMVDVGQPWFSLLKHQEKFLKMKNYPQSWIL